MITEVSRPIRCQKNPEVGVRRIYSRIPPNTPLTRTIVLDRGPPHVEVEERAHSIHLLPNYFGLLIAYWMMSSLVSKCFYMPQSAQPSMIQAIFGHSSWKIVDIAKFVYELNTRVQ